jgi:hypothetical protein
VVVAIAAMLLVASPLFAGQQALLRYSPGPVRRRLTAAMVGNVTASLCMPLVVWLMTPPDRPAGLLLAFPLWLILQGLLDFALAPLVGLLYVIGALEFGVAVVMALHPPAAPLLGAAALTVTLALRGLGMRRLGADRSSSRPSA